MRKTLQLTRDVITPEECDVYSLKDPEGPHSFRSAIFRVETRVHATPLFSSWCVVQLLPEHRTPKGVPNFNSSRSINIALLWSDDSLGRV